MPAPSLLVAFTVPPVMVMFSPLPSLPPPMPAAEKPPVAVTVPPVMVMFSPLPWKPPPMPAALLPPVAVRLPASLLSSFRVSVPVEVFSRPAL